MQECITTNNSKPAGSRSKTVTLLRDVAKYILLLVAAFCFMMPILWFMTSSFRTNAEVFGNLNPFSLKMMFFGTYTLENYGDIFANYNFGTYVFNTIVVCAMTVTLGVLVASMAGYAFAKMKFFGRKAMFLLVVFAIMVPFDAIAIPLYSIIISLDWNNTYQALVLPTIANGMVIFMFKQTFRDMDDALSESAQLDGAGEFGIFFRIILPISIPSIISGALILFMAQWNAFMWPLLCARTVQFKMLQVALADFSLEEGTEWSKLFAGITVGMTIPCCILMPFQKYYIRGIATTGMKE
ncbi:MAG TPA: carbohydrate ABC transporter permease [Candidatus Limiplasma sp.]|nr:carbohydrate ABC transporter permease [Candidatus Limiplasma sp.]